MTDNIIPKSCIKILIVDDKSKNIYATSQLLQDLPITIDSATSGNEALKMLLDNQYALVILDVQMPGMDGFQTADLMRLNRDTQHIPIIFITAINTEKKHMRLGYNLGAVDYLCKPFDPHALQSKVRVFVNLFKIKQELQITKTHIENTLNSVSDGIVSVDMAGVIQYVNPAGKNLFATRGNVVNLNIFDQLDFYNVETEENKNQEILGMLKYSKTSKFSDPLQIVNNNKKCFIVELGMVPLPDINKHYIGMVFTVRDITEKQELSEKLHYQATHDKLTALPNRYHFSDMAEKILRQHKRNNMNCILLYIDIDDFKIINDSLGHHYGDLLLKEVSKKLSEQIRETDICARLGGDEFVIIFENLSSTSSTIKLVESIMKPFQTPVQLEDKLVDISMSIGIACYPEHGDNIEKLLKNSDIAMYESKKQGKNTYQFFTQQQNIGLQNKLALLNDLKLALRNNKLTAYYQPQFSLKNNKIIGAEALVRWEHDEKGFIPPLEFIPLAEDSGFIKLVGRAMQNNVMHAIQSINDSSATHLKIAINVSALEFHDDKFIDTLLMVAENHKVCPEYVELEITEGILLANMQETAKKIATLNKYGFHTSIDDFGTGYSNLSYLKDLEIHTIKIDKSFIDNMLVSDKSMIILSTLLELINRLQLTSIAEGVETIEQIEMLKELGCDVIQGFVYQAPMPLDNFVAFVNNFNEQNQINIQ